MHDEMPTPVARRLGYAIKRAQHALRLCMDQALRPTGMTTAQYAVLCALEAEPGLSNARLARAAFVTAQAMQGVLANLERGGILQRTPAPDNARILRARLTAKGTRTLARAHAAVRMVEARMVASFGAAMVEPLTDALTRCAADLTASLTSDALADDTA